MKQERGPATPVPSFLSGSPARGVNIRRTQVGVRGATV
jgi:hypothetical protein